MPCSSEAPQPPGDRPLDPFHATADPDAYVRRDACEEALDQLCAGLGAGRQLFVLHGPAGYGKTLLLRLLPRRLRDAARLVYVPYGALEPADLCALVVAELRATNPARPPPGGEQTPEQALLAQAQILHERGTPLVVAVDDASALAPESVRRLVQLARQSEGALRWIVVPIDDARAGRVVAALGLDVVDVRLRAPLAPAESRALLEGCLARSGAPQALRDRFDPRTLERLHRAAGGSPRRLLVLASHFARGDEGVLDVRSEHEGFDPRVPADDLETDDAPEAEPPELELDDPATPSPRPAGEGAAAPPAPAAPTPARVAPPHGEAPEARQSRPWGVWAGLLLALLLFAIGIWMRAHGPA